MKRSLPRSPARAVRVLILLSFTLALIGATTQVVSAQSSILKEIYFTDGGSGPVSGTTGKVRRVNPDGSGLTTLHDMGFSTRPRGIALDPVNGHIYWNLWTDPFPFGGRRDRANLDGTGVTTIHTHGQGGSTTSLSISRTSTCTPLCR